MTDAEIEAFGKICFRLGDFQLSAACQEALNGDDDWRHRVAREIKDAKANGTFRKLP